MKRRDFLKGALACLSTVPFISVFQEKDKEYDQNPAAIIQDMMRRAGFVRDFRGEDLLDEKSFKEAYDYCKEEGITAEEKESYPTLLDGVDDITHQSKSFVYLHNDKIGMAAVKEQLPYEFEIFRFNKEEE